MSDTKNDTAQPPEDDSICSACGAVVPGDAPSKMCPSCLAARIMMTAQDSVTAGSFTPPSIEELQRLIPHIDIEELIGVGGMGAVYQARHAGTRTRRGHRVVGHCRAVERGAHIAVWVLSRGRCCRLASAVGMTAEADLVFIAGHGNGCTRGIDTLHTSERTTGGAG